MMGPMMDYAFKYRDLRVKKDVSDLKLDPLFWRRVLWKNHFLASYRTDPSLFSSGDDMTEQTFPFG